MGFLNDLKGAAEKVKDEFESVEDELKKDMKSVLKELGEDWDAFEAKVKGILEKIGSTEDDLFNKAKAYFERDMQELGITNLRRTVSNSITTIQNDVDNIEKSITAIANSGAKQGSDEFKFLEDTYFKPIGKDIENELSTYDAISIGLTEEISGVLGESEILSIGYKFSGDNDVRILSTTGISFGAEEGAEVGAFVGVWTKGPKNLKGAFLSFDFEVDDGVGIGIKVYLDILALAEYVLDEALDKKNHDWGYRGIILLGTTGEVAEASGELSGSMTFRIPH